MVRVHTRSSAIGSLMTGCTIMREAERLGVNFMATESVNLILSRAGFLELRLAGGGGGGTKPPPPLRKNPVPLLNIRIYSSKSSENLSKIESCEANLVSMEAIIMVLRWFIVFRFFTRNHRSKIKNLLTFTKSKKAIFSESL